MCCWQLAPPLASTTQRSVVSHFNERQASLAVRTHCAVPVMSSSHVSPGGHCCTAHGSVFISIMQSACPVAGSMWHTSVGPQVTPAQGSIMCCWQLAPPLASTTQRSVVSHFNERQASLAVRTHCAVPVVSSSHVSPGGHCCTAHGSVFISIMQSACPVAGSMWHTSVGPQVTPAQGSTMCCWQLAPPLASTTQRSVASHFNERQASLAVRTHCAVPVVSSSHVSPGGHCNTAHGSVIISIMQSACPVAGSMWHTSVGPHVTPAQGSIMCCWQLAPPLASRTQRSVVSHFNERQASLAVRTHCAVPVVSSSHVSPGGHCCTAHGSVFISIMQSACPVAGSMWHTSVGPHVTPAQGSIMCCWQLAPPLASRTQRSVASHFNERQASLAVRTHCAVPVMSSSHVSPGGHCNTAHGSVIISIMQSACPVAGSMWHTSVGPHVTPAQGSTMCCWQLAPPLASRTQRSVVSHFNERQASLAVRTHCAVPVVSSSHVSPGGHCNTAHGSVIISIMQSACPVAGSMWHTSVGPQVTPAQGSIMCCWQLAPPLASTTQRSVVSHFNERQASLAVRTHCAVPVVSSSHVSPGGHCSIAHGSVIVVATQAARPVAGSTWQVSVPVHVRVAHGSGIHPGPPFWSRLQISIGGQTCPSQGCTQSAGMPIASPWYGGSHMQKKSPRTDSVGLGSWHLCAVPHGGLFGRRTHSSKTNAVAVATARHKTRLRRASEDGIWVCGMRTSRSFATNDCQAPVRRCKGSCCGRAWGVGNGRCECRG